MDDIRDMIAAQRGELAQVLAQLPAASWDAPTLCDGWRVRVADAADRLGVVLPNLVTPKSLKFFGTDLSGVQLRATDTGWTFGSGTPVTGAPVTGAPVTGAPVTGAPVTGTAQDLALLRCGRSGR